MRFPFDLDSPTVEAVLVIMALMSFVVLLRYVYLIFRSKGWRMTRARVVQFDHERGSINQKRPDRVNLRYQYAVDGREYEGNKVGVRELMFPGIPGIDFPARPSTIRKLRARAQSSGEITVYYDPRKPKMSCVDPSPEISLILFLAVCAGLLFYFAIWF